MNVLVSRDSKGKFRVAELDYEWSDSAHAFLIHRKTGQLNGKMTVQPDKKISCGKASRTLNEQVKLEYAHLIKEFKDKGYKELNENINTYTEEELNNIVGENITGISGVVKPMLAKQADKITNKSVFNKNYYCSRKIDGLRCIIYMDSKGELHTASRGAMNYDAAMIEILQHPLLIKLFRKNPWLIMDGECYKHGYTLQQLNKYARTQVTANDYSVLQFYWYDIVDLKHTFAQRLIIMQKIQNALNLKFEPNRQFEYKELRIQCVPQVKVSGWDNIMNLHNQYITEGWEGAVIRLEDANYGPNKRSNDMIKVKAYKDKEFKVIGYELGLRGSEDMCFKCVTEDGLEFLAKPHGDRALKQQYIDNFETQCLNKMAVVKYFYYSDDGIPLQPSVKCIRLEEDIDN